LLLQRWPWHLQSFNNSSGSGKRDTPRRKAVASDGLAPYGLRFTVETTPAWSEGLLATVASVLADLSWYQIGRLRGVKVLRLLCRISL